MKALILIGGQGTRLRPFTSDIPKPLLPVLDQPLLDYQLRVLGRHGIKEIVLCTSYRSEVFQRYFAKRRYPGVQIHFAHEPSPLGTGGALRNADRHLSDTSLVLNGDILNDMDITQFLKAHRKAGAELSIALTRVKDPSQFGLVETDGSGRVRRFVEKPSAEEISCDTVNAGAYLFEPSLLRFLPPFLPYSLERQLFPQLLENQRRFHGFVMDGYWIDVGTVESYLQVHLDVLGGRFPFYPKGFSLKQGFLSGADVSIGRNIYREGSGQVSLGHKSRVGDGVRFIGSASVGERCQIEDGAVLENCVILANTRVGRGARLERCVIGQNCNIGSGAVVGAGRSLGNGSVIEGFSQL